MVGKTWTEFTNLVVISQPRKLFNSTAFHFSKKGAAIPVCSGSKENYGLLQIGFFIFRLRCCWLYDTVPTKIIAEILECGELKIGPAARQTQGNQTIIQPVNKPMVYPSFSQARYIPTEP